jgi:predicted alpha/beta-hydrolase family hydrolase
MARRREDGKPRPPDRESVLLQTWVTVIDALGAEHLVVGGKSLGGRMASMVVDEAQVRGLVCLGYPFHPPGRSERTRTSHLETLRTPTLIVQGARDPFGVESDTRTYNLSRSIELYWVGDGDHSYKPRKRSGRTLEQNLLEAAERVVRFLSDVRGSR